MSNVIPIDQSEALPSVLTPMDMLNRAVTAGADINVLEKLMALQERWEANQARKAFDEAVAQAKAEMPAITKNRKGHTGTYADFAAIAAAVDPIISRHGLSYRFRTVQTERINVTCILSHKAGHAEETTLAGPADTSGSKNAIQAIGSTLTYLQRYTLVQALGLAASNDDDGAAAKGGETITAEQADELIDLLEVNGKDRAKFLRWAKVERVEDIPAAYFKSCVDAITGKVVRS